MSSIAACRPLNIKHFYYNPGASSVMIDSRTIVQDLEDRNP